MDTWTASIVDLSYPLTLSRFCRLEVASVIPVASASAGGGPGTGCGGISREGGWESEDWDEFAKSLMRLFPSTVIVVEPENWPVCVPVNVGIGGMLFLLGFLT